MHPGTQLKDMFDKSIVTHRCGVHAQPTMWSVGVRPPRVRHVGHAAFQELLLDFDRIILVNVNSLSMLEGEPAVNITLSPLPCCSGPLTLATLVCLAGIYCRTVR